MADAGPPQRPPFNDPHDPRWYSDPASRGTGSGGPEAGSHAVGSPGSGPAGAPTPPPPGYGPEPTPFQYGAGRTDGSRESGNSGYGSSAYGGPDYGGQSYGGPGYGAPGYGAQQYSGPQFPQPYGTYAPAEPRGLSITALALGAAAVFTGGLLLVPQILAVVFGHIALRREPAGRPLALTGLIMGYVMLLAAILVVIAFIGLIAASTTAPVPGGP